MHKINKILIQIGVIIGLISVSFIPQAKADSQMQIGDTPFAYGVNVVACEFISYVTKTDAQKKEYVEKVKTTRKMMITGEMLGNTLGYLADASEQKEKDSLYFVTMLDDKRCVYSGNPDNKFEVKGLGQLWEQTPFKGRSADRVENHQYGLLRTLFIPGKKDAHQTVLIISNGNKQTYRTDVVFEKDEALNKTIIKTDGKLIEFRTCANYVVNMDYLNLSAYKTEDEQTPIDDELVLFTIRNASINGDHNVKFGSGFQYTTLSKGGLSPYHEIVSLSGHNYTPWDYSGHKKGFAQSSKNLLHGGMIGVDADGDLAYIYAYANAKLVLYKKGSYGHELHMDLDTCAAKISKDSSGNVVFNFVKDGRFSNLWRFYYSKENDRIWNQLNINTYERKGGPALKIDANGYINYSVSVYAFHPWDKSEDRGSTLCAIAQNEVFQPPTEEDKDGSLYPDISDKKEFKDIRDFLVKNGKIKIVSYGLPYGLIDKALPKLEYSLEKYESDITETGNSESVETSRSASVGTKALSFGSSVLKGSSYEWGHKDIESKTKRETVSSPNDESDYDNLGMIVYVKGNGYIAGCVKIQTFKKDDPKITVDGKKYSVPFNTYYAQTSPAEFQISSTFFNVKEPSAIAVGLEARDFGNLVDSSEEAFKKIRNWEDSKQLRLYLNLAKNNKNLISGITEIDSYSYSFGSTYGRYLAIGSETQDYTNSSWYAGRRLEANSKIPGIAKFHCEINGMSKGNDAFTKTIGTVNSVKFDFSGMKAGETCQFKVYVLDIDVSTLKSYLSTQDVLSKGKPFFVPTLNWETNEDFVLIITSGQSGRYMPSVRQ